jgi:phosphohistidine phosphatase
VTSRRLVLIRHAKAEQDGSTDAERELAPRGLRDAVAVGEWLTAQGVSPDHVVVSPARRAQQTWEQIAGALASAATATVDDRIYDNSVEQLLAVIHDAPADSTAVVLVGHNPSMHALAFTLDDGSGDAEARRWVSRNFPTSALAVFEIEADWASIDAGSGHLRAAAAPRG